MKNILFVADPLDHFKIYKDTTFSMMREAQRRGHHVAYYTPDRLSLSGERVFATVQDLEVKDVAGDSPEFRREYRVELTNGR